VSLSDDARRNREAWDAESDEYQALHADQLDRPLVWGVWAIPEAELGVLGDVDGKDVLELGCGAAQWSIFLATRGARPVALDNSARQLEHARRLLDERGLDFPLVHASAETIPLPDASFDLVFCDHGATSFTDPNRTIPEVARVLRPGGLLAFNMASPLFHLCWDEADDGVTERLCTDYFDMHRFEDDAHIEFQLGYGEWIRLLRRHGFTVEDLIELRPPPEASTSYPGYAPLEWARRWPAENIWKARLDG
jgi:SAM-dependent methyltransferase